MSSELTDLVYYVSVVPRTGGTQMSPECPVGKAGQIGSLFPRKETEIGETGDSLMEPQQEVTDDLGLCPPNPDALLVFSVVLPLDFILVQTAPDTHRTVTCARHTSLSPVESAFPPRSFL